VEKADMAFELEFADGRGEQSPSSLQMHAQYFATWELERHPAP
jgi:hypothetical protein